MKGISLPNFAWIEQCMLTSISTIAATHEPIQAHITIFRFTYKTQNKIHEHG